MLWKPDNINIILCDDHQLIVDGLKRILQEAAPDSILREANDGATLLNLVRDQTPHCIVMDVDMPVMNGLEAARQLSKNYPDVRIVIISMHSEPELSGQALRAGAHAFIIKNAGKDELLKAIQKVMQGERYISESIAADFLQHHHAGPVDEPRLTVREKEIVNSISRGLTNNEIAEALFISPATVETHRKNILSKLKVKNTAALVRYAFEHKII
ncbi:response regulator [Chryseolinea lacunae]|uniref:Response regulator transcription factor n=1 Tax=Chryseolinea lacunae TaxID=2801331 RepID=A0ABS1KS35_9BACT|nr:response regulator transcription factor [Chryseolinea lacunae]MBL0742293.1 response regulator transcription factor [Chryseolinea lacunae]